MKDKKTGEILKVGESSVKNIPSRLNQYVVAGRRTDREVELETVTFSGGKADAKQVEAKLRNQLKENEVDLNWYNEGIPGAGPENQE